MGGAEGAGRAEGVEGAQVKVRALQCAGRLATTAVTVFEVWRGLETEVPPAG